MFEDQNDKSYLKRYVQNHPTNRMAWYLLGKQYMEEGKDKKANYCFLQSGSVYEAYERKQHELALDPSVILEQWNKKRRNRRLLTRISVASVLFLGLILAAPFGMAKDEAEQDQGKELVNPAATAEKGLGVFFIKPAGQETLGNALGTLLSGKGNTSQAGLAVMLQQDGKWRKWTGKTRILAEAKRDGKADAAAVRLLDSQTCDCQPGNASAAYKAYGEWSQEQEMRWTLASAITHYHERTKSWPAGMDDLTRSYPNNVLSGTSPQMKKLFPQLLQAAKGRTADKPAGIGANSGEGKAGSGDSNSNSTSALQSTSSSSSETRLSDEPLSIIVDKDSHQLAVVSGDVIVRSYTVGLGGKKTPLGAFFISEKVKNPNGRDDSEFGSRGMTLSNTLYAIHGTDEPDSIGKDESHGCVRMNKKDLEELYDLVPLGTKVEIKSDVLPGAATPAAERFRLKPVQDETNTAVVYRWLT
ncbi:L,D-transpeptidase [Paenibacillus sp. CF384]|uniref:L,D-transpeptidase n=1 Tax=Paenibacillus sp. CF384 TaxID=1884382 RepID=UPI00089ACB7A|nr:L,D-transpeptidase [Paenibacillus sp. CF384]SDW53950.1 L,D-transpeptidase catalytic domain [Paenibacillus sp. CF384]